VLWERGSGKEDGLIVSMAVVGLAVVAAMLVDSSRGALVVLAFLVISRARRSQSNASGRPVVGLGSLGLLVLEVRAVRKMEAIRPDIAFEKLMWISSRDIASGLSDLLASLKKKRTLFSTTKMERVVVIFLHQDRENL